MVDVGLTTFGLPVPKPPLQLYDVAPLAVNVELEPLQIVVGEADTVTLGKGLTVTVTLAVLVQPLASVPVTV